MTGTDATEPELVETTEVVAATIRETVSMAGIRDFFDRSFATLGAVMADQGVTATGPPFGLYHSQPTDTVDVEVGFPTDQQVTAERGVEASSLPAASVARVLHHGSFDGLGDSWGRLAQWIVERGRVPGQPIWEVYLTEPSPDMDPADLRTELNWTIDA